MEIVDGVHRSRCYKQIVLLVTIDVGNVRTAKQKQSGRDILIQQLTGWVSLEKAEVVILP